MARATNQGMGTNALMVMAKDMAMETALVLLVQVRRINMVTEWVSSQQAGGVEPTRQVMLMHTKDVLVMVKPRVMGIALGIVMAMAWGTHVVMAAMEITPRMRTAMIAAIAAHTQRCKRTALERVAKVNPQAIIVIPSRTCFAPRYASEKLGQTKLLSIAVQASESVWLAARTSRLKFARQKDVCHMKQ